MNREWSKEPLTGWVLLAVFLPLAAWLAWEIERTIGLSSPRLWVLLKTDRVFDLAMLDFALTASFTFLVVAERIGYRGWRAWVSLAAFCVVPTLGIALALVLAGGRKRVERPADLAD